MRTNNYLEEILNLADELSESQAQTVFIQLQSMIHEAEENVKYQKLKNLREEVVSIRADQENHYNKDTNQLEVTELQQNPEEPTLNSKEMTNVVKDMRVLEEVNGEIKYKTVATTGNYKILGEFENVSSDVVDDLLEMQVTQKNLMPEIPEELLQALPQELIAIFQRDMQTSLQMMAHLSINQEQ